MNAKALSCETVLVAQQMMGTRSFNLLVIVFEPCSKNEKKRKLKKHERKNLARFQLQKILLES